MKTWIFDCDGVLYLDDTPVPGADVLLAELGRRGDQVLFCTNNSTRTQDHLIDKLRRLLGYEATAAQVLTSAMAAAEQVAANGLATAGTLGMRGVVAALEDRGIEIVEGAAEAIVVGLDFEVTYDRIRAAADLVRAGALFVATNTDATYPVPGGFWPGAGTVVSAVATAGGRLPDVIAGKPHEAMVALLRTRIEGHQVTVVGDRPETDLALAKAGGWESVGVLTGIIQHPDEIPARFAPDRLIPSVADLLEG